MPKVPSPHCSTSGSKNTRNYTDLTERERISIRCACIKEQGWLCAYCCQSISADQCHNEHLKPQSKHPKDTLNYENIVASCNGSKICGQAKGNKDLPLNPLMLQCEQELYFSPYGDVCGTSDKAKQSIAILNLNFEKLRELRKRFIQVGCCKWGVLDQPDPPEAEEQEILAEYLVQLQQKLKLVPRDFATAIQYLYLRGLLGETG